jgi:hypothetical protein
MSVISASSTRSNSSSEILLGLGVFSLTAPDIIVSKHNVQHFITLQGNYIETLEGRRQSTNDLALRNEAVSDVNRRQPL